MKEIVSFGSSPEQTRFRELVARFAKVHSIDVAWKGTESSTSTGAARRLPAALWSGTVWETRARLYLGARRFSPTGSSRTTVGWVAL